MISIALLSNFVEITLVPTNFTAFYKNSYGGSLLTQVRFSRQVNVSKHVSKGILKETSISYFCVSPKNRALHESASLFLTQKY